MSSSQGGGTPQPNFYPVPKYIVLFQHGWNGSGSTFNALVNRADSVSTFLLSHIVKGSDEISDLGIPLKNLEISLLQQGKTLLNKILFIRTEFSDNKGSVYDQSDELNIIIDYLKFIYQNQAKIILVGHSKGGLVGVEYATHYSSKVHGLISIGTPYNYQALWNFFSGDATLWFPHIMTDIKDDWNALQNKPKAYAIASQAIPKTKRVCTSIPLMCWYVPDGYTDGVVDWENARGYGYSGITGKNIGLNDLGYTHSAMLNKLLTYQLVMQLLSTF